MFFEQIGEYTRAHLQTHIAEYLSEQQSLFDDKLPLVLPKTIDVSSLIGGVMQVARDTLPQYAINIVNKRPSTRLENLYLYEYPGELMLMVGGNSASDVDRLAWRHATALEKFIKEHQTFHQHSDTDGFLLMDWVWISTTIMGAMQLEKEDSPVGELWVNAAQLDVIWTTSEMGTMDVE